MMLLHGFIAKEILRFLESEFIAREPQLQQILLDDVAHEIKILADWLNKKISENPKEKSK